MFSYDICSCVIAAIKLYSKYENSVPLFSQRRNDARQFMTFLHPDLGIGKDFDLLLLENFRGSFMQVHSVHVFCFVA